MENGALTIANLSVADAGMFQCVAENKHGLVRASAELRVTGEPRARRLAENLVSPTVEILRVSCHTPRTRRPRPRGLGLLIQVTR